MLAQWGVGRDATGRVLRVAVKLVNSTEPAIAEAEGIAHGL